jgi:predicted AlkP superfamily phosphohydrolase/phosphomutase
MTINMVTIHERNGGNVMTAPKVVVIGLDGATFDLLDPWIEQGELPILKTILGRGVHGPLQVEVPCNTVPNWPSFMAGVNPGKHGFFDFFERQPDSYTLEPAHPGRHHRRRFWDVLADAGYRAGAINVPATFPPTEIENGVLITGMFTPTEKDAYTYPPALKAEILEHVPDYRVNFREFYPNGLPDLMADLTGIMEARLDAAEYLWEAKALDCLTVIIRGTDRIGHDYFHLLDRDHPRYSKEAVQRDGNPVLDYYRALDARLAQFIERLGPDTRFLMMSDHGQMPYRKIFATEFYLLEKGFMQVKDNWFSQLKYRALKLGWSPRTVVSLIDRFHLRHTARQVRRSRGKQAIEFQDLAFFSHGDIDWSKSVAYCPASGGVYVSVNLRGREPQGCVSPSEYEATRERIIESLLAFRDPENGVQVIPEVHRREEVYDGPDLDAAPDLILETAYGYGRFGGHSMPFAGSLSEAFGPSGTHSPLGIFAAWGPDIKQGAQLDGARIRDLAPTVLHLFDCPIPADYDGRVLTDIYDSDSALAKRPVRQQAQDASGGDQGGEAEFSAEEQKEIEDRLRALGYI